MRVLVVSLKNLSAEALAGQSALVLVGGISPLQWPLQPRGALPDVFPGADGDAGEIELLPPLQ